MTRHCLTTQKHQHLKGVWWDQNPPKSQWCLLLEHPKLLSSLQSKTWHLIGTQWTSAQLMLLFHGQGNNNLITGLFMLLHCWVPWGHVIGGDVTLRIPFFWFLYCLEAGSPSRSQTHYVTDGWPWIPDTSAPALQVLEVRAYATTPACSSLSEKLD